MKDKALSKLPARYRPTIWARIHYLLWSLVLLVLWPIAWLFRRLERLRRNV